MKTKTIQLYNFEELSEESRERALNDFNNNNDYPFLEDNLNEYLSELLKENGIKGDAKLYYSLSYCQGDGLCFEGNFEYKGVYIDVKHQGNYYHKNSVSFEVEYDGDGDDLKNDLIEVIENEFIEVYNTICDSLEKSGYSEIEYEQSEENFKELCELNEYTFRKNGEMENA